MGCAINACLADKLIGELHSIQSEYAIGIPRSSYLSCDNFSEVGMSVSKSHAGGMPCLWHSLYSCTNFPQSMTNNKFTLCIDRVFLLLAKHVLNNKLLCTVLNTISWQFGKSHRDCLHIIS